MAELIAIIWFFGGVFTMVLAFMYGGDGFIHTLVMMILGFMAGASAFWILGNIIVRRGDFDSISSSGLKMAITLLGTTGTTYIGYTYYGEGFVDTLIGTVLGFVVGLIVLFFITEAVIEKDYDELRDDYRRSPEGQAKEAKRQAEIEQENKRKQKAENDAYEVRFTEVYEKMYNSIDRSNMSSYEVQMLREEVKSRATTQMYSEDDVVKRYTKDILAGRMRVTRDRVNNRISVDRTVFE